MHVDNVDGRSGIIRTEYVNNSHAIWVIIVPVLAPQIATPMSTLALNLNHYTLTGSS